MVGIVERPDLSQRTALSKSALGTFDLCQTKSWYSIHDPKPFVPNEKVSFGSAVDAGVETILKYARMAQPVDDNAVLNAATFVIERDGTEVDLLAVTAAFESFQRDVQPKFDWALAGLQVHLTATLEGLGECDGHPDIVLADNTVLDIKTSGRFKEVPSLELGFYALLAEEVDPTRKVPKVGYLNYIRSKKPYWQIAEAPVTEELRRWAYEKSAAYVRARKADVALNRPRGAFLTDRDADDRVAQNYSMTGGPQFAGLCKDCPYNPANGGPCLISLQGEEVTLDG